MKLGKREAQATGVAQASSVHLENHFPLRFQWTMEAEKTKQLKVKKVKIDWLD